MKGREWRRRVVGAGGLAVPGFGAASFSVPDENPPGGLPVITTVRCTEYLDKSK